DAGARDVDDPLNARPHGCLEHIKRARDIQVPEVVNILGRSGFVNAVPGGNVDNTVHPRQTLLERLTVQDGTFDIHPAFAQGWPYIEADRNVATHLELSGQDLAQIARTAGQEYSHGWSHLLLK